MLLHLPASLWVFCSWPLHYSWFILILNTFWWYQSLHSRVCYNAMRYLRRRLFRSELAWSDSRSLRTYIWAACWRDSLFLWYSLEVERRGCDWCWVFRRICFIPLRILSRRGYCRLSSRLSSCCLWWGGFWRGGREVLWSSLDDQRCSGSCFPRALSRFSRLMGFFDRSPTPRNTLLFLPKPSRSLFSPFSIFLHAPWRTACNIARSRPDWAYRRYSGYTPIWSIVWGEDWS